MNHTLREAPVSIAEAAPVAVVIEMASDADDDCAKHSTEIIARAKFRRTPSIRLTRKDIYDTI